MVFIILIIGLKKYTVSFFHIYNKPIKSETTNDIVTLIVILSNVIPKVFRFFKLNKPTKDFVIIERCGNIAGSFLMNAYISHIPISNNIVIQA